MSVIYRPHRGSLADSMAEAKEFENFREMFIYIQGYYKNLYSTEPFRINEIVLSDIHADNRIGWKDAMHICVKRFCNEQYEHPQCIGMCATDYNKG